MIKVDLITGFLGSGKTTFLLKYAKYLMKQGLKIGILEYDYGSINVDMMLINGLRSNKCEIEMLAAACDRDCLERRFRTKLIAMAMSGYDRVIIEPSGIFDIDMFFDALREEPLENWYEIGSVISIVSADTKDLDDESRCIMASQLASSGCILLSKSQEYSKAVVENTKEYIKNALEYIKCSRTNHSFIDKNWAEFTDDDLKRIMNSEYQIADFVKNYSSENKSFSSVSLLEHSLTLEQLRIKTELLFAESSYGNIERIKGFVFDSGKNYLVNLTKTEKNITECSIGSGVLIIIGNGLDEKKILEELE